MDQTDEITRQTGLVSVTHQSELWSLTASWNPTLAKLARLTRGGLRLSNLPPGLQEYMEDVIASAVPRNRVVYRFFDEEQRL